MNLVYLRRNATEEGSSLRRTATDNTWMSVKRKPVGKRAPMNDGRLCIWCGLPLLWFASPSCDGANPKINTAPTPPLLLLYFLPPCFLDNLPWLRLFEAMA